MTSLRATAFLGVGLVLTGCDPARTGDYHGNVPAPVRISVPGGATVTGPDGIGYNDFSMAIMSRRDVRRWYNGSRVGLYATTGTNVEIPEVWLGLAQSLCSATTILLPGEQDVGRCLVMGTILGAPNYVYLATNGYTDVEPTGPGGERLTVEPGFHVFHRSCTADNPNHFEAVPLDTALVYEPEAAVREMAGLDPYLEACGAVVAPTVDLGTRVGTLPPSVYEASLFVRELVWAPGSRVFYLLAGRPPHEDAEILSYTIGEAQLSQVAFGGYYGPLEVANGGNSLLVTSADAKWDNLANRYMAPRTDRLRLSLVSAELPAQTRLPYTTGAWFGSGPIGALSPDGSTIATVTSAHSDGTITLVDVKSGGIRYPSIAKGTPLAWDPTGSKLLVATLATSLTYKIQPVDGSPPTDLLPARGEARAIPTTFAASAPERDLVFWTTSGPKVLVQGGTHPDLAGLIEEQGGVAVYDFVTGETTAFIDLAHQAPPIAPIGVVVATEQVFAWAIDCLGLGETSCTSELRRLSLATGAVDVVARADGPLPFAVAPDGSKLAFAYKDGIYLKTIAP